MSEKVLVPDVGEAEEVTVVEVLVAEGDQVEKEDSVVVLESDKASMEIPSPFAGKVTVIKVKEGDTVDEGGLILELETESDQKDADEAEAKAKAEEETAAATELEEEPESEAAPAEEEKEDKEQSSSKGERVERTVTVPDVGNATEVVAVEILVKEGDQVDVDDSLIVLESDKASLEVPAPAAGTVKKVVISEGDQVEEGDDLLVLETRAEEEAPPAEAGESESESAGEEARAQQAAETETKQASRQEPAPEPEQAGERQSPSGGEEVHAGPAVRKQAREYGVDLTAVKGSGRKGRIVKEDVQTFVKDRLTRGEESGIPKVPAVDFAKYGDVEYKPLSRVRKVSARNLHRSWLNVPHVTQFDEADITDLEVFRKARNEELKKDGVKLSPLAFLVKICASALSRFPNFNASLDQKVENLIIKHYYNIGIAVDTAEGLVVPVIRDADKKGVMEIAEESAELAALARDNKLPLDAMQGATFTISSLGGIGGTAFTPIVNSPEVAILGVSKTAVKPVFDGKEFQPRAMLPLSLSYDHRAIDGAEAVRFTTWLSKALADVRHAIM